MIRAPAPSSRTASTIDFRPILFVIGVLLTTLAAGMCIPAVVDAAVGNRDWQVFAAAGGATLFVGVALTLTNRVEEAQLTIRQAFLLTALTWTVVCAFAALPFQFSGYGLSYTDSFFEAMSGLTTTGSTVITRLDDAPAGLLLWRGLLHGLGGIGIVVMAVAVLPMLRIGGMQLFRTESSDRSEKILPRVSQIAGALTLTYLVLFLAGFIALYLAGMTALEACVHAFAAISTGGFSTSDASIGHFNSWVIELIVLVFMFLGGMTFALFIRIWQGELAAPWYDSQFRWYLGLIVGLSLALAVWQVQANGLDALAALRSSTFNVVSLLTTTGFVSEDYTLWGSFPVALFFMMTFIGGCTGSTSGAIKIFRFQVLFGIGRTQMKRLLHPHGVFVVTYNDRPVSDQIVASVLAFIGLYALCFAALALGLSMFGLDLVTSLSGAATAIGNVGPGLGDIIGPAGTFAPLPDGAKWLLSAGMLLGRLELLTVLVLLTPAFWRG